MIQSIEMYMDVYKIYAALQQTAGIEEAAALRDGEQLPAVPDSESEPLRLSTLRQIIQGYSDREFILCIKIGR